MPQVRRDDVAIAYEETGSGPPIVLLHSFLCSGEMWANQVAPLSVRHRVVNVDLRGHGSSGPSRRPFTLDDLVDDVLAVLDALEVRSAVWAGLSIGGMIGLRAALRAPERVAALVLADTDAGRERTWVRLKHAGLSGLVRVLGFRPVLPQVRRQMFGTTTRRARPGLVAEWVFRFTRVDVPTAIQMLRALTAREDLLPRLGEVPMPALVLVGAEDASLPPPMSRRMAQRLPRARLVEIAGAGHLSALEEPAAFNSALLEFLESADVRG